MFCFTKLNTQYKEEGLECLAEIKQTNMQTLRSLFEWLVESHAKLIFQLECGAQYLTN